MVSPSPAPSPPFTVTFVCTGNICRSPIAEAVVADLLTADGLAGRVLVDSAGIGDWHVGENADPRAVAVLSAHGLDATGHRARQFDPDEMASTDLLIAMDTGNADVLRSFARTPAERGKIRLMRSFDPHAPAGQLDVPDPYYGQDSGFVTVLDQVRAAAPGLLTRVRAALDPTPTP